MHRNHSTDEWGLLERLCTAQPTLASCMRRWHLRGLLRSYACNSWTDWTLTHMHWKTCFSFYSKTSSKLSRLRMEAHISMCGRWSQEYHSLTHHSLSLRLSLPPAMLSCPCTPSYVALACAWFLFRSLSFSWFSL